LGLLVAVVDGVRHCVEAAAPLTAHVVPNPRVAAFLSVVWFYFEIVPRPEAGLFIVQLPMEAAPTGLCSWRILLCAHGWLLGSETAQRFSARPPDSNSKILLACST